MNNNYVELSGNVWADPTLTDDKFRKQGVRAIVPLEVLRPNGTKSDCFFVYVYGDAAAYVRDNVTKGTEVRASGYLRKRVHVDHKNSKKTFTAIVANHIEKIDRGN